MNEKNLKVAELFLAAWQRKDLKRIGEHLHPNVHFKGPMNDTTGKEAFLASVQRILTILISFDVRLTFASGDQAVAIYDFNCAEPIGACRTAELLTFQGGLITAIELFLRCPSLREPRAAEKLTPQPAWPALPDFAMACR